MKIKPVGDHPLFQWSDLLKPSDVQPGDLPEKAGVYVVVATDGQGKEIKQTDEPIHSPLSGVVYVGMAGSNHKLKGRFSQLARAWRTNNNQQKPSHGSRKHYNEDSVVENSFSVENVRLRFMPLPTHTSVPSPELNNLATAQNLDVGELLKLIAPDASADEHVLSVEAGLIQWFKRQYKYKPVLNRDDDGSKDSPPTDAWLNENLADKEQRGL